MSLGWFAWLFVIIGALNWGLIGVSNLNVVQIIFGWVGVGMITQIVYILVGLSGLYILFMGKKK
jgi:hypothetical protein